MTSTFDLRQDIAEIPRENDTVDFTFKIALAAEVKRLRGQGNVDEALLAEKEAELEASRYKVELVSVPKRRREDIYREALDKFPGKPSLLGAPDERSQFDRGTYSRVAVVAAAVVRITRPSGEVMEDGLTEAVQMLHDEAPGQVFERIEAKVRELNEQEDEQDALRRDTDF